MFDRWNRADPKLRALRHSRLFGGMSNATLSTIARAMDVMSVGAGTCLAAEGRPLTSLFLVADGELELSRAGRPVGRLGPGEGGFVDAFRSRSAAPCTVAAAVPTTVLVCGHAQFRTLKPILAGELQRQQSR